MVVAPAAAVEAVAAAVAEVVVVEDAIPEIQSPLLAPRRKIIFLGCLKSCSLTLPLEVLCAISHKHTSGIS